MYLKYVFQLQVFQILPSSANVSVPRKKTTPPVIFRPMLASAASTTCVPYVSSLPRDAMSVCHVREFCHNV